MVGLAIGLLRNAPDTCTSASVKVRDSVSLFIALSCSSIIPTTSSFIDESRSRKMAWFSLPLCRVNVVIVVLAISLSYQHRSSSADESQLGKTAWFSLPLCHINVVNRWKMIVSWGKQLGSRYLIVVSTSFAHGSTCNKF